MEIERGIEEKRERKKGRGSVKGRERIGVQPPLSSPNHFCFLIPSPTADPTTLAFSFVSLTFPTRSKLAGRPPFLLPSLLSARPPIGLPEYPPKRTTT